MDNGIKFIKKEFGHLPRVAFSIDGFGHSSISPYILNHFNYESIVITRVPYEAEQYVLSDHNPVFDWEGDNGEVLRVFKSKGYSIEQKVDFSQTPKSNIFCLRPVP
jgi:hypothetical protein